MFVSEEWGNRGLVQQKNAYCFISFKSRKPIYSSKAKTANSCSRIVNGKSSDMGMVRVEREKNGIVYSLMALIE